MYITGVSKRTPDHEASAAVERGFDLYVSAAERRDAFVERDLPVAGSTAELLAESTVVVDATPAGVGAENAGAYADTETSRATTDEALGVGL